MKPKFGLKVGDRSATVETIPKGGLRSDAPPVRGNQNTIVVAQDIKRLCGDQRGQALTAHHIKRAATDSAPAHSRNIFCSTD